ncbi:L37A1 protein, partial [Sula dactylatra]|nr:L37A1 protein [Sula dactylatra]
IQNYSSAVEQTKTTHGMEDVKDVEDAQEAPSPRQDYVWTYKKHKQEDSLYKRNQLFYKLFGNVNPEEGPTPTESKAEQRLNTKQHFFYNLLVNLLETKAHRPLHLLIPDEALRMFFAHMARALRLDCALPELQLACTKMVWKVGLLINLLSERQDDPGASALVGQCLLEGNISNGMAPAREAGRRTAGKWKAEYTSGNRLLLAISASVIIMINLMVICLIEICSQKPAAASQPQSTTKSCLRRFFQKLLPQRWSKNKYNVRGQGSRVSNLSKTKPQWLRDLYQPLNSQHKKSMAELYDEDTSDEEEIFNKSELK